MTKNEVAKLVGGIKFIFGDNVHLQIVSLYAEIGVLERSVKKNNERKVETKEIDKKNKIFIKEIKEKEKQLEWLVKNLTNKNETP